MLKRLSCLHYERASLGADRLAFHSPAVAQPGRGEFAVIGTHALAVLVLFWYFCPVLAGKIIQYSDWLSHVWYTGLPGPVSVWV